MSKQAARWDPLSQLSYIQSLRILCDGRDLVTKGEKVRRAIVFYCDYYFLLVDGGENGDKSFIWTCRTAVPAHDGAVLVEWYHISLSRILVYKKTTSIPAYLRQFSDLRSKRQKISLLLREELAFSWHNVRSAH